MMRDAIIKKSCLLCGDKQEIKVNQADYDKWMGGELIQKAMPYLNADEREMLISDICPTCFNACFEEDEDIDFDDEVRRDEGRII